MTPLLAQWPDAQIKEGPPIARISAVGSGMRTKVGTAARMFRAIADANINIAMIATSEIRTSCVVSAKDGIKALNAVHKDFNLDKVKIFRHKNSRARSSNF